MPGPWESGWARHIPLLLLAFEALACAAIIFRVPYTEIDWKAYMQEVAGWADEGHYDYTKLKGDTGPLVYPAGFLYLFRFLRWMTGGGEGALAIRIAQWMFGALYLLTQAVVFKIYKQAGAGHPILLVLLVLSKRMHSLFVLRLFNDCFAMVFAYMAVLACMKREWFIGTLLFSMGVSVKMNVLLFLPGLLFLLVRNCGIKRTILNLAAAVAMQLALGAPFLATYPREYLSKAFELSRVFMYQWTVNWKFLPEQTFVSPALSKALLGGHIVTLLVFGVYKWCSNDTDGLAGVLHRVGILPSKALVRPMVAVLRLAGAQVDGDGGVATGDEASAGEGEEEAPAAASSVTNKRGTSPALRSRVRRVGPKEEQVGSTLPNDNKKASSLFRDSPLFTLYVLFTSNFIGIVFSRTLHYQFYTWYYHALPLLVLLPMPGKSSGSFNIFRLNPAALPLPIALVVLAGIEYAFNVGDASGAGSPLSSFVLQACHAVVLGALLAAKVPAP